MNERLQANAVEAFWNLIYLAGQNAEDPEAMRKYMALAETQVAVVAHAMLKKPEALD